MLCVMACAHVYVLGVLIYMVRQCLKHIHKVKMTYADVLDSNLARARRLRHSHASASASLTSGTSTELHSPYHSSNVFLVSVVALFSAFSHCLTQARLQLGPLELGQSRELTSVQHVIHYKSTCFVIIGVIISPNAKCNGVATKWDVAMRSRREQKQGLFFDAASQTVDVVVQLVATEIASGYVLDIQNDERHHARVNAKDTTNARKGVHDAVS